MTGLLGLLASTAHGHDGGGGAPGWLLPVGVVVVVAACAYALGLTRGSRSEHDG